VAVRLSDAVVISGRGVQSCVWEPSPSESGASPTFFCLDITAVIIDNHPMVSDNNYLTVGPNKATFLKLDP